MKKRLRAKLSEVKTELRRRITQPIPEQGEYLRAVLTGHARYYGVPGNGPALMSFRHQEGLRPHVLRWLPRPHICHPWPAQRLDVTTQGKSRMR